mmetsp:Transcript_74625/g.218763  ORF Transcript_74625/g.218763 Transcript_74625/m.218763 type:complete len:239 (+) Transcript_74625:907-1623(+)
MDRLCASKPLRLVQDKEPLHQVSGLWRCPAPSCAQPIEVSFLDALDCLVSADGFFRGVEGVRAGEQDVEHNAHGPQVCGEASPLMEVDLGCRVREGAPQFHAPGRGVAQLHGCPEVAELHGVPLPGPRPAEEQEVLRLEVAVHDAAKVQVVHRPEHLAVEPLRLRLAQAPLAPLPAGAHQAVEELAPAAELHDHAQALALLLKPLMHPHDVRVLQRGQHRALVVETRLLRGGRLRVVC